MTALLDPPHQLDPDDDRPRCTCGYTAGPKDERKPDAAPVTCRASACTLATTAA